MEFGWKKCTVAVLLVFLGMCGTVASDDKYILWDFDGYTTNQVGIFNPSSGYVYLVVDLEFENHGYSEFEVNPFYFEAVVNKVSYPCDAAMFDTSINILPTVTLQDGGKISGQVVYQVPKGTTTYSIEYTGFTWMGYDFVRKSS